MQASHRLQLRSALQPTVPTLNLWLHKPHAEPWPCPLPQSQAESPWPIRHTKQPPAHHLLQPLGGHLGPPCPSTSLVFVASLIPQVRQQQTQHRLRSLLAPAVSPKWGPGSAHPQARATEVTAISHPSAQRAPSTAELGWGKQRFAW